MFKTGDKVKCIMDDMWANNHGLYEGKVYTVTKVENECVRIKGHCVDESCFFGNERFEEVKQIFTKKDIQPGMLLQTRDNSWYACVGMFDSQTNQTGKTIQIFSIYRNYCIYRNYSWLGDSINDNLTNNCDKDYDVVNVIKPNNGNDFMFILRGEKLPEQVSHKVIWQRESEEKTQLKQVIEDLKKQLKEAEEKLEKI